MPLTTLEDGRLVVTIDIDEFGYFDVANAALFISRSQAYVRALARRGSLEAVTGEDDSLTFHRDTLEAYNAKPRHGGRKAGEIPYSTLSSTGRRLRSVIRSVEATTDAEGRAATLAFLQAMLTANIAENVEQSDV